MSYIRTKISIKIGSSVWKGLYKLRTWCELVILFDISTAFRLTRESKRVNGTSTELDMAGNGFFFPSLDTSYGELFLQGNPSGPFITLGFGLFCVDNT